MTAAHACNVCGTREEPTFEAGGLWWCAGCAAAITTAHVEDDPGDEMDFTTPEGYDDSPDQGVHRHDGGGAW